MNPKQNLIDTLNKKVDLFQTTIGKANTNVTATTTMILDSMAQTILTQYEKIEELEMEIANLKAVDEVPNTSGKMIEGTADPTIT